MLPLHLIAMLEGTTDFKELPGAGGKNYSLENVNVPVKFLDAFCRKIKEKVLKKIADDPTLIADNLVRKTVISGITLKRLIEADYDSYEQRQRTSINALLIFLDIEKDKFEFFRRKDLGAPYNNILCLRGNWYIYRYHDGHLMRTLLKISMLPDLRPVAIYRSISGTTFRDGEVILNQQSLTLRFSEHGKTIDICALSSNHILSAQRKFFNGIIRSIQLEPFATKCIIIHDDAEEQPEIEKTEAQEVVLFSEKEDHPQAFADRELDPVVTYLRRAYAQHNELRAPGFQNSSLQSIMAANAISANDHYKYYSEFLANRCYSISHAGDGFRVKCWQFYPDDGLMTCTVTCQDENRKFTGSMSFHRDHASIDLDASGQSYAHVILKGLDRPGNNRSWLALTSEVDGQAMRAYREVFLSELHTDPDLPAFLTREELLAATYLQPWEKGYLDTAADSIGFLGIRDQVEEEITRIGDYAHKYLAYIPNIYSDENNSLFQITLEIDKLGKVVESLCLDSNQEPAEYRGQAEKIGHTLRLSNINTKGQKSEYLFITSANQSWFLQGVTIDTDKDRRPCADVCIAIRLDCTPNGFKFSPAVLTPSSPAYIELDQLIKSHIGLSIKEYFFEFYSSIRYKDKARIKSISLP